MKFSIIKKRYIVFFVNFIKKEMNITKKVRKTFTNKYIEKLTEKDSTFILNSWII